MNEVYMNDDTFKRLKDITKIINTWSKEEFAEFSETQILEICIGFTFASVVSANKGYSVGDILKSAIVVADMNRKNSDDTLD